MRGRRFACLALWFACVPAWAEDAPPQPFIERTLVVAPLKVGDFVLEGARYDPAHKLAGVSIRYFLPGHEATRIDLFVYPHGQRDEEEALVLGMRDFHASLEAAEQGGYYRDLAATDAVEFDVPLLASPGDAVQEEPAATDAVAPAKPTGEPAPDEARRMAMLLELLDEDRHVDGRMIELAYDYPGQAEGEWLPMRSRGYLFYRHLYFFKGRISAAAPRIDAPEFAALADRAMRELVPAVQAYIIGSCGDTTIQIDTSLPEKEIGDALMREIAAAQSRSEARNCHAAPNANELAALAENAEVATIEYAAEDWGGN